MRCMGACGAKMLPMHRKRDPARGRAPCFSYEAFCYFFALPWLATALILAAMVSGSPM